MPAPILQLNAIHLTFGGTPLLSGADLILSEGERIALVGRNGSGKSTLLKIAAGLVEADQGERMVQPGATIRYLPQEPDFKGFDTTAHYVEAGLAPGDDPYRATYLLNQLGLTGEEVPAALSGGQARRAALARTLAPKPDILLLDEPTNHLDLAAIEWLEDELHAQRGALILISHDRRFLDSLSRACIWLDRGQTRRLDRGFGHFEAWRDEVLETEERDRHKLDRRIAMEEDWVRYGVTARRKRNMGRMARLQDLRRQRRDARRPTGQVKMTVSEAEQTSKLMIEAQGLGKTYGGRAVVSNFSIRIQSGDRIGIVGANGSGKSTLLKLLTGQLAPESGIVRLAQSVAQQTLDQARDALEPALSLKDFLTGGRGDTVSVNGQSRHVSAYMKDFLFAPEQMRTPVSALSGGERGRLLLAKALATPSNLLVMDEPTNDLDLETLDLLQELLADYQGTVLLVSHDRDFLDRVVTATLFAEGDGRFLEYAGGYTDMAGQRGGGVKLTQSAVPKAAKSGLPKATPADKANALQPKRKMTFKDRHALETLPTTIAKLESEIADISAKAADPNLFARDRKTFDSLTARLAAAQQALTDAEDRWLELEALRQEIEGAA